MKKIFALLSLMLATAECVEAQQFTPAEHSVVYVLYNDGCLSAYPAYNTVFINEDPFAFTYNSRTTETGQGTTVTLGVALKSFTTYITNYYPAATYKALAEEPEVGVCYTTNNVIPTIDDNKVVLGNALTDYTIDVAGLQADNVSHLRAYVKVGDAVYYDEVYSTSQVAMMLEQGYTEVTGQSQDDTQTATDRQNMLVICNDSVRVIPAWSVDWFKYGYSYNEWTKTSNLTITNDSIVAVTHDHITAACTVTLTDTAGVKTKDFEPDVWVCYAPGHEPSIKRDSLQLLGAGFGHYQFTLSSLIPDTTYRYRVFASVKGFVHYGETATVKTAALPDTIAPKPIDPDTIAPAPIDPDTITPKPINPDTIAPTPIDPDTIAPTPIDPDTIAPTPIDPDTIAPTPIDPDTIAPTPIDPDTIAPTPIDPDTIAPTPIDPDTIAPEPVKPDTIVVDDGLIINGHKFVDLGLSSGLLWAETNIGAELPADVGDLYAWGETTTKSVYTWDNYKYGTEYSKTNYDITKYNSTEDGKTILEPEDDAAYVNWGSYCRMPTGDEIYEILYNCSWTWTYRTNSSGCIIDGYLVTSLKNGNSIFIPVMGSRADGHYSDAFCGYLWSSERESSPDKNVDETAGHLYLTSVQFCQYGEDRCAGYPVRPVAQPAVKPDTIAPDTITPEPIAPDTIIPTPIAPDTITRVLVEDGVIVNGHKFVDLDLPSGMFWAETNIGAVNAADDGDFFAWGETETKTDYSWSTYKYGKSMAKMIKYNSTDEKTVLDSMDDAAYVNWGSYCRMPTGEEVTELRKYSNCTWTWTSMTNSSGESIYGYKVTSVRNGNSIFFPASGMYYQKTLTAHGTNGYCWSSSIYSGGASKLSFSESYRGSANEYPSTGFPVRAIINPLDVLYDSAAPDVK